jgi:malate dehydrogenase
MVPIVSTVTVGGIPLTELLSTERIEALVERTRKGGGEIVKLLGTGSAYYAPSSAAVQMVEAIVRDKKRILPCAAWLEGEFGLDGLFLGVPCKLGKAGLEGVLEVPLTDGEQQALAASAEAVRGTMDLLSL